ncbi:MAG TPA: subclass B3 metallo-beta-lactamase [Thermoanaerobaculia bacterium]|jgi:metallo-beta-lactamase class B|nr:subclass B3 metallo-beta-lactamase [Thermoanaerobaculia bacterium]
MLIALLLAAQLGNDPVEPFRIVGNIYYVGASDITSYLITTPKGHIVLDGGFAETAPMIVANIRKLGFEPRDVRYILNSHAHLDHAGGIAELRRVTGAKFLASAPEAAQLARGGLDDPQFGNRFPFPPAPPDQLVRDRQQITLGGTTLTAHITAGHTRGCTTWTMRAAGRDVVFLCSATAPTDYRLVGNPRWPDAVADYRRTFATLRALPCDVFLAAHGGFFDLQSKIGHPERFVDPAGYKAHLDALEESFNKRVQP